MNEERRKDMGNESKQAAQSEGDDKQKNSASRARNRTVMLTPEMTGQVRALLGGEEGPQRRDPLADLLPPISGEYTRPSSIRASERASEPLGIEYGGDATAGHSDDSSGERTPTGRLRATSSHRPHMLHPAGSSASPGFPPAAPHSHGSAGMGAARKAENQTGHQVVTSKAARTKIVGFMVSFDKNSNGEVYEIRAGRWLLTSRQTDHSDYILIDDESISPLHAIVRATQDGKIQVLDQLSEFGTAVMPVGASEEQDITGSMTSVGHGDKIRFGKRLFIVCLVPRTDREEEEEKPE